MDNQLTRNEGADLKTKLPRETTRPPRNIYHESGVNFSRTTGFKHSELVFEEPGVAAPEHANSPNQSQFLKTNYKVFKNRQGSSVAKRLQHRPAKESHTHSQSLHSTN